MTIKIRRIIYITFIIIFIILSTAAIFYTSGYRYDFKKEKVEKKGGMILEFKPKEVKIYINNEFKQKTNFLADSFKITNLLPGEYLIKIEKDDYHYWEKKIKIESEKINFVKNIVLFKKQNLPKIIFDKENIEIFQIPNKNKLLIRQIDNNLSIFKIYNEKTKQILDVPNLKINDIENIKLKFSLNGNKILLFGNYKNYIYDFNQQKLFSLETKISKNIKIKNPRWDQHNKNIIFFLNQDREIFMLNLVNYDFKKIFSLNKKEKSVIINDFYVNKDEIYLITKNSLIKTDKQNSYKQILLTNISTESKFKPCPKQYITLIDKIENNLIIFDKEKEKIVVQDNAKNILWSEKLDDNCYLIAYNNDFEIYTSNLELNKKELIIRHSEPISQIAWHPDYAHLFFTHDNSINIVETCENIEKNSNLLFENKNIKNIMINNNKDKIYFRGSIGSQKGLFELDI
ncbi:MAG: hypothetical protein U9O55_03460 [Patescibacteria group bacterium]|nr:hypothetical protein [Patescibacteria group bacterium]